MKMFKKLMAVMLAGVMALAVLTGCGSALNEKELIKILNDELKITSFDGQDVSIKEFKADTGVTGKAKAVAKIVAEKAKKEADLKTVLGSEDVKKATVGENDTAVYQVSYVKSVSFGSKYYNNMKDYVNLRMIGQHANSFNSSSDRTLAKDATILVGFADVKLDDGVYTIVVMQYPTEKKA